MKLNSIVGTLLLTLLTGCGSDAWRLGNHYEDPKIMNKRQKERDRMAKHADEYRVGTAKHYIKEYKSRDGKINIFKRDGFDW